MWNDAHPPKDGYRGAWTNRAALYMKSQSRRRHRNSEKVSWQELLQGTPCRVLRRGTGLLVQPDASGDILYPEYLPRLGQALQTCRKAGRIKNREKELGWLAQVDSIKEHYGRRRGRGPYEIQYQWGCDSWGRKVWWPIRNDVLLSGDRNVGRPQHCKGSMGNKRILPNHEDRNAGKANLPVQERPHNCPDADYIHRPTVLQDPGAKFRTSLYGTANHWMPQWHEHC